MIALFIGGPLDSKIHDIPDGRKEWYAPCNDRIDYFGIETDANPPKINKYIKRVFMIMNKEVNVFFLDENILGENIIILRLFSAYWKDFDSIFSCLSNKTQAEMNQIALKTP